MAKTFLILVLCAPFAWVALIQGRRLYELSKLPVPSSGADETASSGDTASATELARIRKSAEAIVGISDTLAATAILLGDPPEVPPLSGPLADALMAVAQERAAGRREVEKVRLKAAAAEQRIRDLQDRPGELAELETRLQEYALMEVLDPELLESVQAQAAWLRLERDHSKDALDRLYDSLTKWRPGASASLPPAGDLVLHLKAYRDFLNTRGGVKGAAAHAQESRQRLVLWNRGAKLADLLRALTDRENPADPIRKVADLAAQDDPPLRFVETARRLVQALCDDFLKPKEELDRNVLFVTNNDEAPELFPRDQVKVHWKDEVKRAVSLDGPEFNEYTLPLDQVSHLTVPDGGTRDLPSNSKVRPLRGTEYSDAIRAYNAQRAKMANWSETELTRLREVCEPHKAALSRGSSGSGGPTLIARIDALLEISRRNPNLFVASAP